jgi:arginine/lysine/ornithine decarboxylase
LESLTKYNTPGKLRNLQLTKEEIARNVEARNITRRTSETVKAISQLQPLTEYLGQALMVLPNEAWHTAAEEARDQLIADLRRVLKEGTAFDLAGTGV